MILRKYGNRVLSVTPNFDARAMTEIGFMRDGAVQLSADEFDAKYSRVDLRELTAESKGDVQGDVEEAVLASLQQQLEALDASLDARSVLVVENAAGVDQAKTRGRQTTIVVEGENRLVFEFSIDPPLRVGIYRER